MLLVSTMEERAMHQGDQWMPVEASGSWKRLRTDSPLDPLEKNSPAGTLTLAQQK